MPDQRAGGLEVVLVSGEQVRIDIGQRVTVEIWRVTRRTREIDRHQLLHIDAGARVVFAYARIGDAPHDGVAIDVDRITAADEDPLGAHDVGEHTNECVVHALGGQPGGRQPTRPQAAASPM